MERGFSLGVSNGVKTRQLPPPCPSLPPAAPCPPPPSLPLSLQTGCPPHPPARLPAQPGEGGESDIDHHRGADTSRAVVTRQEASRGAGGVQGRWQLVPEASSLSKCKLSTDHSAERRGSLREPRGCSGERGALPIPEGLGCDLGHTPTAPRVGWDTEGTGSLGRSSRDWAELPSWGLWSSVISPRLGAAWALT